MDEAWIAQNVLIAQLIGMIWWLASDLAADDGDPNSTPETWVSLAEKHWPQGYRSATRFIDPSPSVHPYQSPGPQP